MTLCVCDTSFDLIYCEAILGYSIRHRDYDGSFNINIPQSGPHISHIHTQTHAHTHAHVCLFTLTQGCQWPMCLHVLELKIIIWLS